MSTTPLLVRPAPAVAGLSPYDPNRPLAPIDLHLDGNEGPCPPRAVAEVLTRGSSERWRRYPSSRRLEQLLASGLGVDADRVLVTAGADEALERALRAVCGPGARVVVTTPSFEMIARYARLAGAEVVEVPWWTGPYPVSEVLSAAGPGCVAVAMVSPNNPTGAVVTGPDVERVAEACPGALILLDHAYVEFADEDLTGRALGVANVVVFRTLSKAWGCAGLRLGYAVGDARTIGWMRSVGQPYSVASPSLAVAEELVAGRSSFKNEFVAMVRQERRRLGSVLRDLGVEVLPSQGNFVLVRHPAVDWLREALAGLGIGVRAFAGRPELAGWVRVTLPGAARAFSRLERALRVILAPEALLLDVDGVVADVSASYREAIRLTASTFGVELTAGEIGEAKRAPGSANDWAVTRRLLAGHGVERSLDEITARFEDLYQGGGKDPGLRRHERLIPSLSTLRHLAGRLPLAAVTGRPRRDAERFLAEHGVDGVFDAVVTMEDAAAKPDPAPVLLAMRRLGVDRAWMVGDTPDDVRAARAAGALPLAVLAPGEGQPAAEALLRAGAALLLTDLGRLLEVLP